MDNAPEQASLQEKDPGFVLHGKKIIIFSPQRWSHLYVSKHHYALELAKNNKVWFISAPLDKAGTGHTVQQPVQGLELSLIDYKVIAPPLLKFKMPGLYKKFVTRKLRAIQKKIIGKADICIDFGSYQMFDDLDFIDAHHKIYFLVDDFFDLRPSRRGAEHVFSVSTNIVEKFRRHNIAVSFVNHGLAGAFADKAKERLAQNSYTVHTGNRVKFGYSGNLFIRFLDFEVLMRTVSENQDVEFHFFGSTAYNVKEPWHVKWNNFLRSSPNVKLHGFISPEQLAVAYDELDGFLLCYKPDYKDYHAENSHKVFEYLSSGKVLVSTYLSLYEGSTLINSSPKDQNAQFRQVFADAITNLKKYNSPALQEQRIRLALDNTYDRQLKRIAIETAIIQDPLK